MTAIGLVAAAVGGSAGALQIPQSMLARFGAQQLDPLPPPGFEWADAQKTQGAVVPTLATKIPLAPSVLEKAKVQIPMAWAHFTHQIAENAPEAVDVFASIGHGLGQTGVEYSKLTAAIAIANWKTLSKRIQENGPGAVDVFVSIGNGVGAASIDYSKLAAAMLVANSKLVASKAVKLRRWPKVSMLKREGKAVIARRAEIARAMAMSPKAAALKREGEVVIARRAETAAALKRKWLVVSLKRATRGLRESAAVVMVAAAWTALAQTVRKNAPSALNVFGSIGVGVAAASVDYTKLAVAVAVTFYQSLIAEATSLLGVSKAAALKREGKAVIARREETAAALALSHKLSFELIAKRMAKDEERAGKGLGRSLCAARYLCEAAVARWVHGWVALVQLVKANGPDAVDVFASIRRGVGAASLDYARLAAAHYEAAAKKAATLLGVSKVAALKREGEAVIVRRAQIAAALIAMDSADSPKVAALKAEGEAVIAKRAEIAAALAGMGSTKAMELKAEGEAVIAKRAEIAAALERMLSVAALAPAPAAVDLDEAAPLAAAAAPPKGFEWGVTF